MLRECEAFFFFGLSQHAKEVGLVIFVFDPPQGTEITCDPASDKAADWERKANGLSSCLRYVLFTLSDCRKNRNARV